MNNALKTYRNLADTNGLHDWKVRFLRKGTYGTAGLCSYDKRELSINKELSEVAEDKDVIDVMLHEIAHALTYVHDYPIHGRKALGHGKEWKARCKQVGARPERCHQNSYNIKGNKDKIRTVKYVMVDQVGNTIKEYLKKPNKSTFDRLPHMYLRGRKSETMGKLKIIPMS